MVVVAVVVVEVVLVVVEKVAAVVVVVAGVIEVVLVLVVDIEVVLDRAGLPFLLERGRKKSVMRGDVEEDWDEVGWGEDEAGGVGA